MARMLALGVFASMGITPVHCENGLDAVTYMEKHADAHPDLIVMDNQVRCTRRMRGTRVQCDRHARAPSPGLVVRGRPLEDPPARGA